MTCDIDKKEVHLGVGGGGNMFGYLSLNTICFDEQFFRERTPRKTVSFEDIFEHISFLVYAKWGLLCLFCFNYFSQRAQF